MFRSLLNQIYERDTTVRSQVRTNYEQRCRQFGFGELKWEWPRPVLEELLTGAILESANRQPVNVFVDALDEAGAESAQQLAAYFHRLIDRAAIKSSAVQICISCRHYPIIGNAQAIEIYVEDHNHQDIAEYIHDTLADTELGDDPSQGKRELLRQLIQQANRVFQWAHLMMPLVKRKMLEGESFDDIRRWLREIPTGLEDVYTYILSKVIEVANREQSFLLFQWICLAERPLTVKEMRYALTASNAATTTPGLSRRLEDINGFIKSDERMKRRIKALSGGLTEVILNGDLDETVQVVHQSVNDFLRAKGLQLLHYCVTGTNSLSNDGGILFQCQANIYRSCMAYLVTETLPLKVSRKEREVLKLDFPFLDYAIVNLFVHAEKAARSRAKAVQHELDTLEQMLGQWVQFFQILHPFDQACPANGTTLIHIAAATNLVDIMNSLLSNGENASREDQNGETALHLAARRGHIQAALILLGKGADPEARSRHGRTPLTEAAGHGNVRFIEWILHLGVDLESTKNGAESALHAAAAEGHQGVVEILIGAGAKTNAQGGEFGNALQAAAYGGSIEIVQMLLDAQADVNAQGGKYGNALQAAAASFNEDPDIVQMLLDAQADVNAQGGNYGNALQAAAYEGHTEIVQILLDAQADVNAQGGKYGNALQAAAASFNEDPDIVQMLLDAQADVNAQGGNYGNALQAAAYEGHTEIVQILLDAQADVNAQGGNYGNALQAAAYGGSIEIVQMLLDAQADVNAQGGNYGNALQAAAYGESIEKVQMLLDAQADVNAQGGIFGNALQAAAASFNEDPDIVQMLLDAQADVNAQGGLCGSALSAAIHKAHVDVAQSLFNAGADALLVDELGRTPLHIAAARDLRHFLHKFPLLASAANNRDKRFQTPLHLAIYLGHFKFASMLLNLGADPSLPDGYGRNIMDWAQRDQSLMHEIRNKCPRIVLTPVETQHWSTHRSISRISDTLLHSSLDSYGPLLRQLGLFFFFLGEPSNAQYLFQLHLSDIGRIACDICGIYIFESHFVCKICAPVDLCPSCVHEYSDRTQLHSDQQHEIFEVPDVSEDDFEPVGLSSEHFRTFLMDLVHEFSATNSHEIEMESSHDSVRCPPLKRKRLV
ncbi:hypothetical protein N7494_007182 [Penicillium frequentans]|uniref:Nephrocystin 3-like N-terminal domain-containing protein n=1 Tax=Penicillium frequentans TaxID=3151616 RepID=A0AAD6GCK1_9EURO|nr:hypothetical protein N7494_007182 [Penicillium glabrum]